MKAPSMPRNDYRGIIGLGEMTAHMAAAVVSLNLAPFCAWFGNSLFGVIIRRCSVHLSLCVL